MIKPINFFKDDYIFLSNFHPINITIDGKLWKTSEHMYMACKTTDKAIQEQIRLMAHPGQAKKFARKIQLRPDWDSIKFGCMERILQHKFTLNVDCHDKLIATGDAVLTEGNWWHDNIWGDCFCPRCKDKIGQNHLGNMLMQLRNSINN